MKKFGIRLPIVCALILLVGVTALATVTGSIGSIRDKDENVTIDTPTAENPAFKISRKNAGEDGQLYLVVIRKGEPTNPNDPTADEANLFYMGMEEAKGGVVTFSDAYPNDMPAGTYYVYMSDYDETKLQQVATFDVGSVGGLNTNGAKLGDVDGDDDVDLDDAIAVMRHVAKLPGWDLSTKKDVADVSKNGEIDLDDAIAIMRHVAKLPGWILT